MAKLTKAQRAELREKFGGRCAYCGCVLPEKGWHADHVEPVMRESEQDMAAAAKGLFKLKATGKVWHESRDCIENLNPACAPCNLFKTTFSLEMFREQIAPRRREREHIALTSARLSASASLKLRMFQSFFGLSGPRPRRKHYEHGKRHIRMLQKEMQAGSPALRARHG